MYNSAYFQLLKPYFYKYNFIFITSIHIYMSIFFISCYVYTFSTFIFYICIHTSDVEMMMMLVLYSRWRYARLSCLRPANNQVKKKKGGVAPPTRSGELLPKGGVA